MEFERLEPAGYRSLMDRYKLGRLCAKLFSAQGFSEELLEDLLEKGELEDIAKDDVLYRIHDRILEAKKQGEKVFIAGDYDTDGLCGTAILVRLLKSLEIPYGYYIPNRVNEGYGLSMERTVQAVSKGYRLFILVDNGVKAKEPLEYCRKHGIDTVVLDHHTIEEPVECDFFYHPEVAKGRKSWLCGAGCAYELARTFGKENDSPFVQLAMCATIGDMMELRGENRVIVRKGLESFRREPMPALRNLIAKKEPPYNETDIAFQIVPKLNAVGRLAEGNETNRVVTYLSEDDPAVLWKMSRDMMEINRKRRERTEQMIASIHAEELKDPFPFVYHEDFYPGIVGLAAAHISGEYRKPVLAAGRKGDEAVGSVRAPEGLNVMEILEPVAPLLSAYGGHPQAAGLSFPLEHLEEVRHYFQSLDITVPEVKVPAVVLNEEDLSSEELEELFQYRPYGMGCELPFVMLENPAVFFERELGNPQYKKWVFHNGMSALTFEKDRITDEAGRKTVSYIGKLDEEWFRGKRSFVLRLSKILK